MTDEPNLIQLHAYGEGANLELWCDAVATDGYFLFVLSAAGPQMAINAVAAGLRSPGSMHFKPLHLPRLIETYNYDGRLAARTGGYDIAKTPIGYDLWHMVAISRAANMLLVDDHDTLWAKLDAAPFTTPLLRSWLPHIEPRLRKDNHLRKLRSFGCDAAQLHVGNDKLDEIVSEGIKQGRMKIA